MSSKTPWTLAFDTPWNQCDVLIGTLVPDKKYPTQNATGTDAFEATKEDITKEEDTGFKANLERESGSAIFASLTRLFKANHSSTAEQIHQIESRKAYRYMLKNPRKVFKQLCQDADTQMVLEVDSKSGDSWYMIVGYKTLLDATWYNSQTRHSTTSGTALVPVDALIAPAAALDLTGPGAMDVGGTASHESRESQTQGFTTDGERVYAVHYQRVKLKIVEGEFDSAKFVDAPFWKACTTLKSATATDSTVLASIEGNEADDGQGDLTTAIYTWGDETFEILEDEV